jgi:hypothetical protein
VHTDGPSPSHAIYKTSNKRWYVEDLEGLSGRVNVRELTLDEAVSWCLEHAENMQQILLDLGIFFHLPDITKSKPPRHGGDIVVRCLNCERRRRLSISGWGEKRAKILRVLRRASGGLSGKEVASKAELKCDSDLRGILASLVAAGIATNNRKQGGYVLTNKLVWKKMS